VPWPSQFDSVRRAEGEWLSYLRAAYKLLPGYASTREYASAILVGSLATRDQISARHRDKCIYIPENAIDPARFNKEAQGRASLPLRAAFVGRLVPYKGADMLIEAAAPLLREGVLQIDIIGDGPERARLRESTKQLDVDRSVKLDGWVDNASLQDRLIESDVFAFPSIREFGGGVVLEAMALGLIPIVVDYGGPGELVTKTTGFKIPMGTREQIVESLRETLSRLVAAPESLRAMGARARDRVRALFTWDRKAQQTLAVYHWLLGEAPKPDFGAPFPG
jgi:glycosyltransferase involved in cell wall biosynthesis